MLNVLGVTLLYPPDSRVGAWLSTHECLHRMSQRGHNVSVRTGLANRPYTHDGIPVAGVGSSVTPHLAGVDVMVHHHGDAVTNASAAAIDAGVLRVVMVHGDTGETPDADLVVFNAEHLADRSVRHVVVRPHVNVEDHECTPGERVTLVNMSAEKGVQVFDLLAASMPRRKFLGVMGGYGRQRPPRRNNVDVMRTTADMREVWRQTRVLLVPSVAESWGRVGIEAMCSGIPVIAHPTPGLCESLGEAGLFVDRDDLAGWRAAIEMLDDPDEWARRSELAKARAAEVCAQTEADLDVFCDALEALCGS